MQIERPAAIGDRIGELARRENVLLGEHMLTDEPPALPLARQKPDPVQRPVGGLKRIVSGVLRRSVLDVIPDAQHDGQQFVANRVRCP